jgi:hypothetical protein
VKIKFYAARLAALFIFAAVGLLPAAEPSFMPKTFSAYIGGFNGPSYLVELHDGVLTYTGGLRHERIRSRITPTAAQWREFRQTLDALDVWRWRADYSNETIKDGTQWRLSLEYTDRAVKTGGSNAFPKQFDPYLAAVEKLLDGKTFK